jgi:fucose permease
MRAALLSLAAVSFGAGALGFNLFIWATVHILTVPRILAIAAILPAGLGVLFLRQRSLPSPPAGAFARFSSSPGSAALTLLLSLAVLIQAANEWAVGGWLGIYWIRRLGVRLETALLGLALYWTTLTLGKILARRLSWASAAFRMAAAGAAASIFGWLLLLSTRGVGGAVVGLLFVAGGMGLTYGVVVPMAGERFPLHQPGFFPWIASLALIGGMLAPWSIGQLADAWGIEWAVHVPALGAVAVYLILSVVLLESRLARVSNTASQQH